MALSPELLERFRQDLARVYSGWEWPYRKLVVGVSGGADSLALLVLAQAAMPGRVRAVTVDHRLRIESRNEARHVARIAQELDVPHHLLEVTLQEGNIQSAAREARYAALIEWTKCELGSTANIATAHHADDQVETMVMRLNRASGLAGLGGIRPLRTASTIPHEGFNIVRPLLGWRRHELEDVLRDAGIEWIIDPSNADDRFDRVRLRKRLSEVDWIDPVAWSRSATLLAEANQLVEIFGHREFASEVDKVDNAYEYTPLGFRLVSIEVIGRIFAELGAEATRAEIDRLHARLVRGENASLAGVLAAPNVRFDEQECQEKEVWTFRNEPPRRTG